MSVAPGVYTIILNITGKPNVATLGTNGVDLIQLPPTGPTSLDSTSKWIIRPIGDVPANAYTIQNESTNAFVIPADKDPENKLTFDVKPYAWFITGDLKHATISKFDPAKTDPAKAVNWYPNSSSTFVILASPTAFTWSLTKV